MTDRLNGFTVALEKPIREDDAEFIQNAIRAIRGVLAVTPIINTPEDWIAEQRIRRELGDKLFAVLYPKNEKEGL